MLANTIEELGDVLIPCGIYISSFLFDFILILHPVCLYELTSSISLLCKKALAKAS